MDFIANDRGVSLSDWGDQETANYKKSKADYSQAAPRGYLPDSLLYCGNTSKEHILYGM